MSAKERLSSLEDHLVVYFEQFVHEQPGAVCRQLHAVSVFQDPVAFLEGDATI